MQMYKYVVEFHLFSAVTMTRTVYRKNRPGNFREIAVNEKREFENYLKRFGEGVKLPPDMGTTIRQVLANGELKTVYNAPYNSDEWRALAAEVGIELRCPRP